MTISRGHISPIFTILTVGTEYRLEYAFHKSQNENTYEIET